MSTQVGLLHFARRILRNEPCHLAGTIFPINAFTASTPAFIKLTGGLLRDGNVLTFTVETIETPQWTTLEKFDFRCPIGAGARFVKQESIFNSFVTWTRLFYPRSQEQGGFLSGDVKFWNRRKFIQIRQISSRRYSAETLNELKSSLLTGSPVARVANYTNCEKPPPFPTVSGGPVTLYYMPEEGEQLNAVK